MGKKWQFVSNQVEDGAGKDESTRKIVRKTAMKAFRRNQRLERVKNFMQEQGGIEDHGDLETLDERSEKVPSNAASGKPSYHLNQDSLGSSVVLFQPEASTEYPIDSFFHWPQEIVSLDPFGSSPLGTCSTWHFLFTHFVYHIAPMIQPLGINSHLNPVNTQWARHAMSDPALFHGVLFHASVHVESYGGRPGSSISTLFHRGETIRLVSERLNSSDGFVSDETIAAVGWVASEGNITGVTEQDGIHWHAIVKMLNARGGLQSLGWSGALELLLTLGNIIWSMVVGTPPTIERPTLTGSEFPNIPPSLIRDTSNTLAVLEFGEDIMTLLRFMSELTIAQSTMIYTQGVIAEEIIVFNKLRAAAEHRLLSLRVITPIEFPKKQLEAAVYEACRVAALMCSNCIFREFIPRAVAFRGLRKAFALALTEIETFGDLEDPQDFEELLPWIYFIGGMLSSPAETEGYALRVSKSMSNLGFKDWAEVENCLARCLWSEKMQNKYCFAFWEMVKKYNDIPLNSINQSSQNKD
ncbi:uncharacterized protein LY89DRAFT_725168 [Mollisia scopiformis]|uniref:Uncharacterized protein n=1 Tax=Mollisia scopiformis TaxID=149040 RepID=A0A132B7C7_MOLSC|nr:uncharacterized protein LY89DRAFT_725168 [Mollisia scopiformis]KUJ08251.1 hypothetical protein LY89DRAFT_725168 [Mollisia scopiformis]